MGDIEMEKIMAKINNENINGSKESASANQQ
jgi:hypothetical protein